MYCGRAAPRRGVEDTDWTLPQITKEFGQTVAKLIDGVTKLGKIPYSSREEQQAENIRKMLISMSEDIRVIIIKLADRLHNMRTLQFKAPPRNSGTWRWRAWKCTPPSPTGWASGP